MSQLFSRNFMRLIHESDNSVKKETIIGFYEAIVEENKDPMGQGRVKARVQSIHGNPMNYPDLPWAKPIFTSTLSFDPPEIYDRVWLTFENGLRDHPLWIGTRYAAPLGKPCQTADGKSVYTPEKRLGSEVPREGWTSDYSKPQAKVVARSREGNCIWFEDTTNGGNFTGTVVVEDTGGKYLKLRSFHSGKSDFDPEAVKEGVNDTILREKDLSGHKDDIHHQGCISLSDGISEQRQQSFSTDKNVIQTIQRNKDETFNEMTIADGSIKIRSGKLNEVKQCVSVSEKSSYTCGKYSGNTADFSLNIPETW